jgi:hypothetical protein
LLFLKAVLLSILLQKTRPSISCVVGLPHIKQKDTHTRLVDVRVTVSIYYRVDGSPSLSHCYIDIGRMQEIVTSSQLVNLNL